MDGMINNGGAPEESPGVVVRHPNSCSTSPSLAAKVLEPLLPSHRPSGVTRFQAGFLPRPVVVLPPATGPASRGGDLRLPKINALDNALDYRGQSGIYVTQQGGYRYV